MKRSIRKKRGAVLGLVVALLMAFLVLAVGFFMISLYFGASRETRNATDAGALNVGKKSLTVTVKSQGGDEDQFKDVADTNGEFGLTNINRVWAKALWVAINAQDIKGAGKETGDTSSHAAAMFQAAENISDRLSDKLNDPNNLYPLFNEVSQANNVRMLGGAASTKALPGPNWKTSLLERNEESNVYIQNQQLPSEVSMNMLNPKTDKGGNQCMRGYKGINMYGRDYWFVPFRSNERPRLESQTHFEQNSLVSQALSGWAKPVPNTFSIESRTTAGSPADQRATACVKANPMQTFPMRFPHGYIRLVFKDNKVKWHLNGVPYPGDSEYGYTPKTVNKVFPVVPACGSGTANAQVGMEFTPTIGGRLFPISKLVAPQPAWFQLRKALLQRCREIDPGFNEGNLEAIFATPTLGAGDKYYIVPNPATGGLVCVNESMVTSIAPWISGKQNASPDSESQDWEEFWPPYMYNNEVTLWQLACGSLTQPAGTGVFKWTSGEGTIEWRRGTGFDGFLGEVSVSRTTRAWLTGACSCAF